MWKGSQLGGLWESFPELRTFSVPVFRLSWSMILGGDLWGNKSQDQHQRLEGGRAQRWEEPSPKTCWDWTELTRPGPALSPDPEDEISLFKPFKLRSSACWSQSILTDTCYFSHLKNYCIFILSADISVYISYIPWDGIMLFSYFLNSFRSTAKLRRQ